MTKEELEKEAVTKCFMLTVNTIGLDQRDVELAYVMGAEPREKRIEELIALINAERERQEKCDDVHLRTIAELEKENAELKAVERMALYSKMSDKLTKAKEIIEQLLLLPYANNEEVYADVTSYLDEAEQFLKGGEVEK